MDKIKIGLVDDQQLFRQGLAAIIKEVPEYDLILEAETGNELLNGLKDSNWLPEILLMDMKLPDINGAALNEIIQKTYPTIKVIVVSMYGEDRFVYKMVEAGAVGYLLKNCDKAELLLAINTVKDSGFYFNQAVLQAMQQAAKFKNKSVRNINNIPVELTKREEEILKLICMELSSTEIAAKLFLSVRTIEGHRNNLLLKTGCHNTAGLLLFAIRNELFEIPQ